MISVSMDGQLNQEFTQKIQQNNLVSHLLVDFIDILNQQTVQVILFHNNDVIVLYYVIEMLLL